MGLSLVITITATVVAAPGPVAADQVSNLGKAQAAQIAQNLVLEQLQIGTYQWHYDVDVAGNPNNASRRRSGSRSRSRSKPIPMVLGATTSGFSLKRCRPTSTWTRKSTGPRPCSRTKRKRRRERSMKKCKLVISPLPSPPLRQTRTGCVPTRHARSTRGTGPSDHQPGGNAGQRRAPDRSSARVQAVGDRGRGSPWPWPSSRRHRPRPLQQQSGRHRPRPLQQQPGRHRPRPPQRRSGQHRRRLLRSPLRARHYLLPPPPRHHKEASPPRRRATRRRATRRRATRRCLPSSNAS